MIIELRDATTPMLSVIANASRDVAFEQMSKIGNEMRVNTGKRMQSSRNRHNWFQVVDKNGKRSPRKRRGQTKELGQRTELDGGVSNPPSMANFISSNLMEASGTLVVGGANKKGRYVKRLDGEIVGDGERKAITKHTQSIINKLDTGRRNEYHGWNKGGVDKTSMPLFRDAKYRAANFMMEGFRDSLPYMEEALTTQYERVIGRAVNKKAVNLKTITRRVG